MEPEYTNNQNNQGENIETVATQEVQAQQNALVYMWYNYLDENGEEKWAMYPDYINFFIQQIELINLLRTTLKQKWRPFQLKAYQLYLNDFESYIVNNIWTGVVSQFNAYKNALQAYGKTTNPEGKKLYDIQFKALGKRQGLEIVEEKKVSQPTQKKAPVQRIAEKKQQVVVRIGDPEINIQKLMNTQWAADKYTSIQIFKKQNVNFVFIGHVDAGKSTLTGNILKELGEVDEQQLARNKQQAKQNHMEAFELAGISDVDPSERKRGKTVEYAKLMFSLQHRRFTLFDAPGHKNYVPNMIMGACQADIAILIISSKEGEFQSGFQKEGQTKEHAQLAKALGVSGFLVAVTKMGTHDWSEKRFSHIKAQVMPFLETSCGFKNVDFIPVDSINNVNIHKKVQVEWYKGPCLLEYLNSLPLPQRKPMGPLRIPLIDKFKQAGNLFLYGKLQSGTIIQDQTITILPSRIQATIKQIFNCKDQRLPFAMAGQNVKLKVKGIDEQDVKRGDVLCNNLNYCQETYQLKAHINVLQLPENKKLMASGYQCILHMHAIAEQVEVFKVQAKFDPQTGKNVPATFLRAGEQGIVTIKSDKILCIEKHEFMPSLGRFTLRDQGKTVGFGFVTKIKPAKKLLDEQKEQLGVKKEGQEKILEKDLANLKIEN